MISFPTVLFISCVPFVHAAISTIDKDSSVTNNGAMNYRGDSHRNQRKDRIVEVLNYSGKNVELAWVSNGFSRPELFSARISNGTSFSLRTFVGHQFRLREAISTKYDKDIEIDTPKYFFRDGTFAFHRPAYFNIGDGMRQVVTIYDDFDVENNEIAERHTENVSKESADEEREDAGDIFVALSEAHENNVTDYNNTMNGQKEIVYVAQLEECESEGIESGGQHQVCFKTQPTVGVNCSVPVRPNATTVLENGAKVLPEIFSASFASH